MIRFGLCCKFSKQDIKFKATTAKSLSKLKIDERIENDDKCYTPYDLFQINSETGVPIVYDVHHHRCNPDNFSIWEASYKALKTWNTGRLPLFHISSPKCGWSARNIRSHADFIDVNDFPEEWLNINRDITVDIEAKAKEEAVLKLRKDLHDKYGCQIS